MPAREATRAATVLVTAAGRRTTLVRAFADAARRRGGRAIAADVDGLAPALLLSDLAVRTPPAHEDGYLPALMRAVDEHQVGLVVPTIDPELAVLAGARSSFLERGCRIAISSAGFVDIALDKLTTYQVFGAAGISVPRTWVPPFRILDHLPSDVFVKPRRGSASLDTYCVPVGLLANVLPLVHEPLVQNVLDGDEITIDALLDLDGRPVHYVPRKRIRTIGGESVQGMTLARDPSSRPGSSGCSASASRSVRPDH